MHTEMNVSTAVLKRVLDVRSEDYFEELKKQRLTAAVSWRL